MTRLDNEKFKNGNYKIENRLKASDKRWEKAKSKALEGKKKEPKKEISYRKDRPWLSSNKY